MRDIGTGGSSCAFAIGPVGDYLGYRLNLQAVMSMSVWDSVHLTLPTPTDTVSRSTSWGHDDC